MALLATTTMDSSFGGYDEFPQVGGQLVSQLTMLWEHDACCVANEAGHQLVDVNMAAPELLTDSTISTEPAHSGLGEFPLFQDAFVDGYGFDLESLISDQIHVPPTAEVSLQDVNHDTSWMTTCLDISTLAHLTTDTHKDMSAPESPDTGLDISTLAYVTGDTLKDMSAPGSPDSGISSSDYASSPDMSCSTSPESTILTVSLDNALSPDVSCSPSTGSTILTVSQEDLALLRSLLENDPPILEVAASSQTGPDTLLTTVALEAAPSVKLPPLPISPTPKTLKSSKPTKALSVTDKRERKRTQNKNAATRYREKKREEAREIFVEQTALEEKNKSLKDKMTLITREMQYMKELLVEVYRAKGMIK